MQTRRLLLLVFAVHLAGIAMAFKTPSKPANVKKKVIVHTKTLPKPQVSKPAQVSIAPKKNKKKVRKAQDLLKQVEKNLTAIESDLKKVEPKEPLLDLQFTSQEERVKIEQPEPSYYDQMLAIFKECLLLPEEGAIKLSISVQPNGQIDTMVKILVESEENYRYLQTMLPYLKLPATGLNSPLIVEVTFCQKE